MVIFAGENPTDCAAECFRARIFDMPFPFGKKDNRRFDPKDKTILIVDDETDIRTVVGDLLTLHGYKIVEAKDGAEALRLLGKSNFDLMVLDIMMPEMDGYQVMNALKTMNPELPVVMLTAKAEQQDVWKGYVKGCHLYMTKPFKTDTLIRAVNYLLTDLSDPQRKELEKLL
jgi:CheY-like chemotaxis protein